MARKPSPARRLPLQLTELQRKVLYLRLEELLSFRQIAVRLGMRSASTAYQHYVYAVEKAKRLKGKAPSSAEEVAVS